MSERLLLLYNNVLLSPSLWYPGPGSWFCRDEIPFGHLSVTLCHGVMLNYSFLGMVKGTLGDLIDSGFFVNPMIWSTKAINGGALHCCLVISEPKTTASAKRNCSFLWIQWLVLLSLPLTPSSIWHGILWYMGFPGRASGIEPACQCRRRETWVSIPGLGGSPGGENGSPLQYSCLGNSRCCVPWLRNRSDWRWGSYGLSSFAVMRSTSLVAQRSDLLGMRYTSNLKIWYLCTMLCL